MAERRPPAGLRQDPATAADTPARRSARLPGPARPAPGGIRLSIPGRRPLRITHLVFDFNGTLAADGRLIRGVRPRISRLARVFQVVVLTADTFGTARRELAGVPVTLQVVGGGQEKRRLVETLGGARVAAIGNGENDRPMFRAAGLRIAVCGPEGMAPGLPQSATVLVRDINDALDLLLSPRRLLATLRR